MDEPVKPEPAAPELIYSSPEEIAVGFAPVRIKSDRPEVPPEVPVGTQTRINLRRRSRRIE